MSREIQVSRQVQPRTTQFNYHSKPNLAAQGKGDCKDSVLWAIINTDLIVSRTVWAEEKNTNCQRCLASILYLGIFLISLEFLCTYSKMICLVFVWRTLSLATQTNTNCQSAQGRYLNSLGAPNIYWTDPSSKQQVLNSSQLLQDDQHQYLQI